MKTKLLCVLALAGALAAGAIVTAQTTTKPQSSTAAKPAGDPRIDKLLEQNEQILKNQQEILQRLDTINTGVQQMRRRSS